jgi:hypothetical protein
VAHGHGGHLDVAVRDGRARRQLVDGQKPEPREQRPAARRHDDGHVPEHAAQARGRQVVAVGVRDQHEVGVVDVGRVHARLLGASQAVERPLEQRIGEEARPRRRDHDGGVTHEGQRSRAGGRARDGHRRHDLGPRAQPPEGRR